MSVPANQFAQIQAALLDAYDEAGLRQMLRMQMDVTLDHVGGGENLTDTVFNFIGWAERTGNVHRLINAAYAGNETNVLLQTLIADARSWPGDPYVTPPVEQRRAAELVYLADLIQRYKFWAEKYTPLAGIAEVRTAPNLNRTRLFAPVDSRLRLACNTGNNAEDEP